MTSRKEEVVKIKAVADRGAAKKTCARSSSQEFSKNKQAPQDQAAAVTEALRTEESESKGRSFRNKVEGADEFMHLPFARKLEGKPTSCDDQHRTMVPPAEMAKRVLKLTVQSSQLQVVSKMSQKQRQIHNESQRAIGRQRLNLDEISKGQVASGCLEEQLN